MEEKTIPAQLEEIANKMCERNCKWPERYLSQYKDPETANNLMQVERCLECPMGQLV